MDDSNNFIKISEIFIVASKNIRYNEGMRKRNVADAT